MPLSKTLTKPTFRSSSVFNYKGSKWYCRFRRFPSLIIFLKNRLFFISWIFELMSIKKSISLLIVSALLVLPSGIAKAGNIDVQTNGVRVTVGKNGGINIQSRPSGVNIIPQHRVPSPSLRRQALPRLNRTSKHNTWIKQTTVCNGRSYTHQSTQTSGSGSRSSQTQSSTSTTVCR